MSVFYHWWKTLYRTTVRSYLPLSLRRTAPFSHPNGRKMQPMRYQPFLFETRGMNLSIQQRLQHHNYLIIHVFLSNGRSQGKRIVKREFFLKDNI